MKNDIVSQLNDLKKIKPDAGQATAQRRMLLQQVAASARTRNSAGAEFLLYVREFFSYELGFLAQPAAIVAVLALLIVGGGIFSITAASEATPGSFLYTVKLVGEKTRFALTSNQEDKVKLSVSFAERRVNEMAAIASAPGSEELEKVAVNLVAEIMSVQAGLEKVENGGSAETVAVARGIDEKTAVLRSKLVATKQMLALSTGSASEKIDDAIAGIDATSLKALSAIAKASARTGADTAAVSRRVADKIEDAKEKISVTRENLNTVFSAVSERSEQGVQVYSGASEAAKQKTMAAGESIAEAEQFLSDSNYIEALEKISQSESLLLEAADATSASTQDTKDESQSEKTGTSTEFDI